MLMWAQAANPDPSVALREAIDVLDEQAAQSGLVVTQVQHQLTFIPNDQVVKASFVAKAFGGGDRVVTDEIAYVTITGVAFPNDDYGETNDDD